MKVKGNYTPKAFTVEPHPQKPRIAVVRFFENAKQLDEGWEYDEYQLEMPLYDGLAADVAAAHSGLLAQAKAEEKAKSEPERLASLEQTQLDTDEMIASQEERIIMLELGLTEEV